MKNKITPTTWVYTIVSNPGQNEQLLGQFDYVKNISFIPTFEDKNSAEKGILFFCKKNKNKHEIQAIIYEDLTNYASKKGFFIFILDEHGNIKNKIAT